jgi:hypothetical protein
MADSLRQRIVDAVVDRMKLINGSGDYDTDVGSRVKDSETRWAEDQNDLPAISVFDGDASPTPTSTGNSLNTNHTMPVLVRYYVKQGTTAANARKGIKDIKTAIRQDDRWTVSNIKLVMKSEEAREAIVRNADNFEVEAAEVEFTVLFQTKKFNAE